MFAPRELLRLARVHMLALQGVILLVLLLALLLVKCRPHLTYPKLFDQHKDMEVRGLFVFSNAN